MQEDRNPVVATLGQLSASDRVRFVFSRVIDSETTEEDLDIRTPKEILRKPVVPFRFPTGLPSLDHFSGGGIPPGTVVAIVGAPGSGKTSLGIRLAREAAAFSGAPVTAELYELFCDEGREAAMVRFGQQLGLDRRKLESRDAEALEEFEFLRDGGADGSPMIFELLDDGRTIDDLLAYARTQRRGPEKAADGTRWLQQQVLLVDSIQTAKVRQRNGTADESERLRIARAVGMLKDYAHDTGAIVVFVSEASRAAYGSRQPANRTDPLAWGAETRAIEFAAHLLLVLDGDTDSGTVTVRVTKNRLGPKTSFPVRFDRDRADFREIDAAAAEEEKARAESSRRAEIVTAVEQTLRKHPSGLSTNEVRMKTKLRGGVRATEVNEALRSLEDSGRAAWTPRKGHGGGKLWGLNSDGPNRVPDWS